MAETQTNSNPNHVTSTDADLLWDAIVGEDCDFSSGDAVQIHLDLVEGAASAGISMTDESSDALLRVVENYIERIAEEE